MSDGRQVPLGELPAVGRHVDLGGRLDELAVGVRVPWVDRAGVVGGARVRQPQLSVKSRERVLLW